MRWNVQSLVTFFAEFPWQFLLKWLPVVPRASSLFREMGVLNSNSSHTFGYVISTYRFQFFFKIEGAQLPYPFLAVMQAKTWPHDFFFSKYVGMSQAFFHFWFDETLLFIDFHENDNPKGAKKSLNDMQLNASLVFSKGIKSAGEHEEREGKNGF